MNNIDLELVMDFFLDSDSVSTVNRLAVAVANVVQENSENIKFCHDVFAKEIVNNLDSENHTSTKTNSVDFYESVVCQYTNEEFMKRFNMKRCTCNALINYLKQTTKSGYNTLISFEKKFHIFLWTLTCNSSFNEVGMLFGLHKSTIGYIFHEISSLLTAQKHQFIIWNSVEVQHSSSSKVYKYFKIPNCVGFIDACRLKVGSKRNKKDKARTVLLQGVCDETLSFLDVYVGDIGRKKKTKVYKDSPLSHQLKTLVEFKHHILGGTEYKLRKNLITPFSKDECLTNEQIHFNEVHQSANAYIGRAFQLLLERFVKLNHMDISKSDALKTIVIAACVIHNFIIYHEGIPSKEIKKESMICDDTVAIDRNIVKTALEKREFLCKYMNYVENN